MSADDLRRWEARWAAPGGGGGGGEAPGRPDSFLVRCAGELPPGGPVHDVAAGDGRNALWLAARGRWSVAAVDVAPSAVRRLEREAGARALRVAARAADLDDPGALDGLGGPGLGGPFVALVVVRFKPDAARWDRLLGRLAPGGRLLLCSFARAQHARTGFPLAYCLDPAELEAALGARGGLRPLALEAFEDGGEALLGSVWERPPVGA